MADTFTERPDEYQTSLQRYAWEYLIDYKKRAPNTVRTDFQVPRRLFRYVKREIWEVPEEEFVHLHEPSTDDPLFSAAEICGKTKREITELLQKHEFGAINAEACIEYEREHKNREKVLERFRMKQRREPSIDYIEVTEADIKRLEAIHVYEFIQWCLNDRGVKVGVVKDYLRKIKQFTEWASTDNDDSLTQELDLYGGIREHDLNYKPIEDQLANLKDGDSNGAKVLGYEEAVQLLEANRNPKARALLMVGLKTGIRREEFTTIKLKHVHLDERYIEIKDRKNYHDARVLIDEECVDHLQRYISAKRHADPEDYLFTHSGGEQYAANTIQNYLQRLATNAGLHLKQWSNGKEISEVTPHWLRHTFSNHYMNAVAGTEAGKRECMKLQKSHRLNTSETYSAAKSRGRISMEQRRADYDRGVPTYLL